MTAEHETDVRVAAPWSRTTTGAKQLVKRLRSEKGVRTAVGALDIPPGGGIESVSGAVARERGRKIRLVPLASTDNTSVVDEATYGLWMETDTVDVVMYRADTTPLHQWHIVCHELGHMVLEHNVRGAQQTDQYLTAVSALVPDIEPDTLRSVLTRSGYSSLQEREAELFADLLMEKAARHRANVKSRAMLEVFWGQ
ncbi:MAG: hypothetical protein L0H59_01130 [Tomitella sp.]|nr:hypothetical protein [Tomitella sp.]